MKPLPARALRHMEPLGDQPGATLRIPERPWWVAFRDSHLCRRDDGAEVQRDAVEQYDREHPLPRPLVRAGQIWFGVDGARPWTLLIMQTGGGGAPQVPEEAWLIFDMVDPSHRFWGPA